MPVLLIALSMIALWLPALALADERSSRAVLGAPTDAPPTIDGILDEPLWTREPATTFYDEDLGTPAADQTRAWIAYDARAIYIAFEMRDAQPDKIVARETRRNVGFSGEDRIRFFVNAFGSKRWDDFSRFEVNALGTQNAQIAGGRAAKLEWRGAWTSAARTTPEGWTAELAIPWAILPRPQTEGPRDLTINFERFQARTLVSSVWSYLGPAERIEFTGLWTGVVVPPGEAERPLSLLWYGFTGYEDPRVAGRVGLDARYQVSPQQTGVVSLNPDFGNIERAVTTIDFSYAEVLGAETRPFFQEGAGFYGGQGPGVRPFASQRIGVFDLGAKFFGRVGPATNLGALATAELGQRTDAVVHLDHQFATRTRASLTGVARRESGIDNTVLGGNASHGTGDWSFSANYYQAMDRSGDGDTGGANVSWRARNYWVGSGYSFVSPGFRPRNGFVSFRDSRGVWLAKGFNADWRTGPIAEMEVDVSANRHWKYDGALFRDSLDADLSFETRNSWRFGVGHSVGRFLGYRDRRTNVSLGYPVNNRFRNASVEYAWGRQGGTSYEALEADAAWRFFGKLQLGASTEWVRRVRTETQHVFTVTYDFTPEESLGGRLLARDGKLSAFLSFRKSGYGGTEYFVILGDPSAEGFRPRLVIKVVGVL